MRGNEAGGGGVRVQGQRFRMRGMFRLQSTGCGTRDAGLRQGF